jgi:Helicase conserved C-terminal domain
MIFADMGVHPTPWGYSAYDDIIKKLVARGIPREQIAAIGDAESDAKKQALFEKVRQGSVRVLIGSTQKMGTGTNVQKRLVALHHLDAPWKPAEVEQREGRILRQGNENEEVAIYRYVTEGSFDAYMWQALETKARFISQVITGNNALRQAEDIGGQELSYAEVKAIASGNPAVLTLAEADAELQRLTLLKKNHLDEQYVARRSVRDLPGMIARLSERLSNLTADQATAATHAEDRITLAGRTSAREDVPAILASQLDALPRNIHDTTRVPLGIYHGLRFGLVLHPHFPPDVYLQGAITRQSGSLREHQGPRAILNAVEHLAGSYGPDCDCVRQDLSIAEAQLRDYQARIGKPFLHDAYLSELTCLRDQLKIGLSATAYTHDDEAGPSVAEIAEKIKALKAAHSIEATPQRARQKHSSAEEPVTARIRRRTEANTVAGEEVQKDGEVGEGAAVTPESGENSSSKPPMTFQERIALERQGKDREL